MRKIFDIHGGVHPPENKRQSTHCPINRIPLASEIVLPLNQHIGAPAQSLVKAGDVVLKGQLIAQAQGLISAPVHASTSGTIRAVENRLIPHSSGMSAPCIVITPDNCDTWQTLEPCSDFNALSRIELLDRLRNAGIVGMGGAGFPSAVKLNPRADKKINTLILNGTECEPYITADDMLMRERAESIISGAQLLAHLLDKPEHILVGIEDNKPEAIAAMKAAAKNTSVDIVVFPTKYPSGGEKQLIEIVTGKQVPSGGLPSQIGVVVQNVGTAEAAWRAVRYGEPLISRVTTVVGDSLQTQQNIEVPLGTPIAHILRAHGWQAKQCARLIVGGPMMGFTLKSSTVPVIKTTNCILAPSHREMPSQPPAQACIRCGMCAEACPAELLPQQLFWYAQSENFEQLREHNLFDCIECGACSYVCPSNIPLVQYYRASKSEIRKLDIEKEKSDRSRLRFEARQQRIAQAEAEKEAKRIARKEAAEKAKLLQAQKRANSDSGLETKTPATDTVHSVQTPILDPEKEKSKLARALSSAQSRVERALAQLHEAENEQLGNARIESLKARLKQAEQKVSETKLKQQQFDSLQERVDVSAANVKEKIAASPAEQLQKTINTLEKRIATARAKQAEAEAANSPTTGALKQGVEKLQQKLLNTCNQLAALRDSSVATTITPTLVAPALNAAEAAIERAKAKAAAQATMSPEQKIREQLKSLETRVEKAKLRLKKATDEEDDKIAIFQSSLEKLEVKLAETQQQFSAERAEAGE